MKTMKAGYLGIGSALLGLGCSAGPAGPTEPEVQTAKPTVLYDSLAQELGPITAEIVRANAEQDVKMHLVARVEVQRNEVVEFYEPAPGVILIMGAGAPDGAIVGERAADAYRDATTLWQVLTQNAPMPEALAGAVTRASASTSPISPERNLVTGEPFVSDMLGDPNPPADTTAGELGELAHLTSAWCDSTYYTQTISGYGTPLGACHSGYNFSVCKDHVTGDGYAYHNDIYVLKSNVCPYRGNVTYKVTADEGWIETGSWTVLQNTYRWKYTTDDGCDIDPFDDCPRIRVDIQNATNDGYQFRFQVLTT